MKCPFCGKDFSAYYLKKHIRYFCPLNPERDICIARKHILSKIDEMKAFESEDSERSEYYEGWIDALKWLLETF